MLFMYLEPPGGSQASLCRVTLPITAYQFLEKRNKIFFLSSTLFRHTVFEGLDWTRLLKRGLVK